MKRRNVIECSFWSKIAVSIFETSFIKDKSRGSEKKYKPAHDKTYNKTCVTSDDSDQAAHPRNLISLS